MFFNLHLIGYNFIIVGYALHPIGYKIITCHDSNFTILTQYRFPDRGFSLPVGGMAKCHCFDSPAKCGD